MSLKVGELLHYTLKAASDKYSIHLDLNRLMRIIEQMPESNDDINTYNDFKSFYRIFLSRLKHLLSAEEYLRIETRSDEICSLARDIMAELI